MLPFKRELYKVVCFLSWCLAIGNAVVVVEKGEYKNVLVAISPTIPANEGEQVFQALKDVLSRSSSTLQKATGIAFGEVTVLLPYTWGAIQDLSGLQAVNSSGKITLRDADITVVNPTDGIFDSSPFTIQNGCGEQGLRITVPQKFLFTSEYNVPMGKGKLMAREWIRYRYGVFDENGYMNDPQYPLYFTPPGSRDSPIQVTDCTDTPALYVGRNSDGDECILTVDDRGLPPKDPNCTMHPASEKNENITSSLMYFQDLPNVDSLCGNEGHPHNDMSPNKQNTLCRSQSIWSVMKKHEDFREYRSALDYQPKELQLKVVLDSVPRVVIAINPRNSVGDKATLITKSIAKFLFQVSDETEVGCIPFTDKVDTEHSVNMIAVKNNIGSIIGKLPFTFDNEEVPCFNCALRESIKMLNPGNSAGKGTIILFAFASLMISDDVINELRNSGLCLVVVSLSDSMVLEERLKQFLQTSMCSRLWQMSNAATPFVIMSKLSEMFSSVSHWHTYDNAKFTLMSKEVINSSTSFTLDSTIGYLQVWLTNYANNNIDNDLNMNRIILISNRGTAAKTLGIIRTFYLSSAQNTEETEWTYTLQNLKQPLFLEVTVTPKDYNVLKVRAWVKILENKIESDTAVQMPVILFSELTLGLHPVLHASVVAEIQTPDGKLLSIELLDNGLGDPDITKYDGVYSRYFTQFTVKGDYEVTVTASHNSGKATTAKASATRIASCCGSFVPIGEETSTGDFIRKFRTTFNAISGRPERGYKPSRIRDLRVASWTFSSVNLEWTAPGNEMDRGRVASYEVKIFSTKDDAENKFEESSENADYIELPTQWTTKNYQETENLSIKFKSHIPRNITYFFSVRSRSQSNEISDTSNAVQFYLHSIPPTSPPTTEKENEDKKPHSKKNSGFDGKLIGIIVGVAVAIVILVCFTYGMIYIFVIKPRQSQDTGEIDSNSSPSSSPSDDIQTKKTESRKAFRIDDGTVSASEWQIDKDPINPIQAWPANILVSHHERVQEAKSKKQNPPTFDIKELTDNLKTASNGLLPNPIYDAHASDTGENEECSICELSANHLQEDHCQLQKSIRRVTNV